MQPRAKATPELQASPIIWVTWNAEGSVTKTLLCGLHGNLSSPFLTFNLTCSHLFSSHNPCKVNVFWSLLTHWRCNLAADRGQNRRGWKLSELTERVAMKKSEELCSVTWRHHQRHLFEIQITREIVTLFSKGVWRLLWSTLGQINIISAFVTLGQFNLTAAEKINTPSKQFRAPHSPAKWTNVWRL